MSHPSSPSFSCFLMADDRDCDSDFELASDGSCSPEVEYEAIQTWRTNRIQTPSTSDDGNLVDCAGTTLDDDEGSIINLEDTCYVGHEDTMTTIGSNGKPNSELPENMSLPTSPSLFETTRNDCFVFQHLEAEILDLKLQLIAMETSRDEVKKALETSQDKAMALMKEAITTADAIQAFHQSVVTDLEDAVSTVEDSQKETAMVRNELAFTTKKLDVANRYILRLGKIQRKKEPLFQIGVAVRLGFIDAANRVRIKGRSQIVSQRLHVDRGTAKAKIEATFRGNIVADASIFDPDLGIPDVVKYAENFAYLYSSYDMQQQPQIDAIELEMDECWNGNFGDVQEVTERSTALVGTESVIASPSCLATHPKLLEVYNLRASMVALHAWTKYACDKGLEERYQKLEDGATRLIEVCESAQDYGECNDTVNKSEETQELEVTLRYMRTIFKAMLKKDQTSLQDSRRLGSM